MGSGAVSGGLGTSGFVQAGLQWSGRNPNQRSAGDTAHGNQVLLPIHGTMPAPRGGAGSEGHPLARFQGSLCTEEAKFALQVTVLRLEVKTLWYFNKEIFTSIFVKGCLAFSLLARGEGPVALSQELWGHLMAAGTCSPPPHLAPRARD